MLKHPAAVIADYAHRVQFDPVMCVFPRLSKDLKELELNINGRESDSYGWPAEAWNNILRAAESALALLTIRTPFYTCRNIANWKPSRATLPDMDYSSGQLSHLSLRQDDLSTNPSAEEDLITTVEAMLWR